MLGRIAALLWLVVTAGACVPASAPTRPPSFATVRALIDGRGLRSVDALLAALPESFLSNFVLLPASASAQEASPHAPRAIVYAADASFVIAFNGLPSQRGYTSLDTMEVEPRTGRFVFRAIEFPEPGGALVRFSGDDPAACQACHGSPPHPIWSDARRGLAASRRPVSDDPRYGQLVEVPTTEGARRATAYGDGAGRTDLGSMLRRLDAEATAKELVATDSFEAYEYAWLGALVPACRDVPMVPEELRATFDALYAGVAARGPTSVLGELVAERAAQRDPGLRALYRDALADGDCREMQRRSLRRLARSAPAEPRDAAALLAVCARCHDHGVGPSLPLGDPATAAKALARLDPRLGRRPMPPGGGLTARERDTLRMYLSSVAR